MPPNPKPLPNWHPDAKAAALKRAALRGPRRRKATELTCSTAVLRSVSGVIERANDTRRKRGLKLLLLNDVVTKAVQGLSQALSADPKLITPRPLACVRCGRDWRLPPEPGGHRRSQLYVGLPLDVAKTVEDLAVVYFGGNASRVVDAALVHWMLEEDRPSGWARILNPWGDPDRSTLHPDMLRAVERIHEGDAIGAMRLLQPFAMNVVAPTFLPENS